MSIFTSFVAFAADEGKARAIETLENERDTLEMLAEVGSPAEQKHCAELLTSLRVALHQIMATNAVDIRTEEIAGPMDVCNECHQHLTHCRCE